MDSLPGSRFVPTWRAVSSILEPFHLFRGWSRFISHSRSILFFRVCSHRTQELIRIVPELVRFDPEPRFVLFREGFISRRSCFISLLNPAEPIHFAPEQIQTAPEPVHFVFCQGFFWSGKSHGKVREFRESSQKSGKSSQNL